MSNRQTLKFCCQCLYVTQTPLFLKKEKALWIFESPFLFGIFGCGMFNVFLNLQCSCWCFHRGCCCACYREWSSLWGRSLACINSHYVLDMWCDFCPVCFSLCVYLPVVRFNSSHVFISVPLRNACDALFFFLNTPPVCLEHRWSCRWGCWQW